MKFVLITVLLFSLKSHAMETLSYEYRYHYDNPDFESFQAMEMDAIESGFTQCHEHSSDSLCQYGISLYTKNKIGDAYEFQVVLKSYDKSDFTYTGESYYQWASDEHLRGKHQRMAMKLRAFKGAIARCMFNGADLCIINEEPDWQESPILKVTYTIKAYSKKPAVDMSIDMTP